MDGSLGQSVIPFYDKFWTISKAHADVYFKNGWLQAAVLKKSLSL